MSLLDSLKSSGMGKPEESEFARLSKEDKVCKAFELKMQGVSVTQIAKIFKVTRNTIHSWLAKHTSEYKTMLEQTPSANVLSESLIFLNRMEEVLLYEIHQLGGDERVDPKTGKVIKSSTQSLETIKLKKSLIDTLLKIQKDKNDLMLNTGIIRKEPEKHYHSMDHHKPEEQGGGVKVERSKEEMLDSIEKLLRSSKAV